MSRQAPTVELPVTIACEGPTDAAVLVRLLGWMGIPARPETYIKGGKGKLDQKLRAYNAAARHAPWLVVRDLDADPRCAPEVVRALLPDPAATMCFRLAVRKIEAWLLADRIAAAGSLVISADLITLDPDSLPDPKAELIRLARGSRSRSVRGALVPAAGSSRTVGPEYTAWLIEFAMGVWNPDRAVVGSPSMASCAAALRRMRSGHS